MQIWNLHTNKRERIKNQSRDTVLFTLPTFIFTDLPHCRTCVRHMAVSCFYTLRCVASCFSAISSRYVTSIIYCWIPSYRVNSEFLFGLWLRKSLKVAVIYYYTAQFSPSIKTTRAFGGYDLCWVLTTSFIPSWYIENLVFTMRSWDILG